MGVMVKGATTATGSGTETDFHVVCDGARVPAALWLPNGAVRPPVVLLGHGGASDKTAPRHRQLADWFATNLGAACLAIDGPFHGERAVPAAGPEEVHQLILAHGSEAVHGRMTREWHAALEAVVQLGLVDGDVVGFIGFSLGSMYGLPLCAALGTRLRAVVTGKMGTACAPHLNNIASPRILREAASQITAPVLFQMQWDDEIFPRPNQLELFDLIASPRKVLRAHPGTHSDTWPEDEAAWCDHIAKHLDAG